MKESRKKLPMEFLEAPLTEFILEKSIKKSIKEISNRISENVPD